VSRRINEILANIPGNQRPFWQSILEWQYLQLGFLDRFYETIFAHGPNSESQTDADVSYWGGMILGKSEFTSHPRFLEVAGLLGITEIWDQRGPPDFCEKQNEEWICE
jgi:hypothetical protein